MGKGGQGKRGGEEHAVEPHFDPLGSKIEFWSPGYILGAIWRMVFDSWINLKISAMSMEVESTFRPLGFKIDF